MKVEIKYNRLEERYPKDIDKRIDKVFNERKFQQLTAVPKLTSRQQKRIIRDIYKSRKTVGQIYLSLITRGFKYTPNHYNKSMQQAIKNDLISMIQFYNPNNGYFEQRVVESFELLGCKKISYWETENDLIFEPTNFEALSEQEKEIYLR